MIVTYAYVLENVEMKEQRNNQPLFLLIEQLEVEDKNLYIDGDTSSKRLELKKLLEEIQPTSRLIVRSVVDFSDTLIGLKYIFQKLTDKKITLFSYEEPFFCGDCFLEYLTGFAQLFVTYERKKQQAGYKKALENGTVGRPKKTKEVEQALTMYKSGIFTISQIEMITGISKSTLYRYLKTENVEITEKESS